MKILEMKRHVNKPDESYHCELLSRTDDGVILRYVSEIPCRVGPVTFKPGSTTYAYYRRHGGHVLWKMCGPDGQLIGYLFHICKDLCVDDNRVEYLDLMLDIWIDQSGNFTVLDREEVAACAASGMIGEEDVAWIEKQEAEVFDKSKEIISDFEALLATP